MTGSSGTGTSGRRRSALADDEDETMGKRGITRFAKRLSKSQTNGLKRQWRDVVKTFKTFEKTIAKALRIPRR
jgi:hypothetical protein